MRSRPGWACARLQHGTRSHRAALFEVALPPLAPDASGIAVVANPWSALRRTSVGAFAAFERLGLVNTASLVGVVALGAIMLRGGIDDPLPASVVAVFAGSLVGGLIGFAFSAIAGAILLHYADPVSAVPLLLACSLVTQCVSIARLWRSMDWRGCLPFLAGGVIGIPVGGHLLLTLPREAFVTVFGSFLVCYSLYVLLRPPMLVRDPRRSSDMLAGLAGGITGGAIAFPGAIPTIWCGLRGLSKEQQRGVVQPFIFVMQLLTVVYFSQIGIITSDLLASVAFCAPAAILGTLTGLALYKRVSDPVFRTVTLVFLLISGVLLVLR